ncbi:P1 gene product [Spissistilus festinus reovirus]|uniref:P1 n=1 Tax=Spissistilus festinus reovirus TaxID=1004049 RepID=UPI00024D946C|nr:P1 gene product [Spissistilus festinus reovirus]AEC32487.1 structural protein [Spissistilus festinus reovirus]
MDRRDLTLLLGGATESTPEDNTLLETITNVINFLFNDEPTETTVTSIRKRLSDFNRYRKLSSHLAAIYNLAPLHPIATTFTTRVSFNAYLTDLTPQASLALWYDLFGLQIVLQNELFGESPRSVGFQVDVSLYAELSDVFKRRPCSPSILERSRNELYQRRYGIGLPHYHFPKVVNMRLTFTPTRVSPISSVYGITLICEVGAGRDDDVLIFETNVLVEDDAPHVITLNHCLRASYDQSALSELQPHVFGTQLPQIVSEIQNQYVEVYCWDGVLRITDEGMMTPAVAANLLYFSNTQKLTAQCLGCPAILDVDDDLVGFKVFFTPSSLSVPSTVDKKIKFSDAHGYVPRPFSMVYDQYLCRKQMFDVLSLLCLYQLASLWSSYFRGSEGEPVKKKKGEGFLVGLLDGVSGNMAALTDLAKRSIQYNACNVRAEAGKVCGVPVATSIARRISSKLVRDGHSMSDKNVFHFAPVGYTGISEVKNRAYFVPESSFPPCPPGGTNIYKVKMTANVNLDSIAERVSVFEDENVQVFLLLQRHFKKDAMSDGEVVYTDDMSGLVLSLPTLTDFEFVGRVPPAADFIDILSKNETSSDMSWFKSVVGVSADSITVTGVRCVVITKKAVIAPTLDADHDNTITCTVAGAGLRQTTLTFSAWKALELTTEDKVRYHGVTCDVPITEAMVESYRDVVLWHQPFSFPKQKGAIRRTYTSYFEPNAQRHYTVMNISQSLHHPAHPTDCYLIEARCELGQVNVEYTRTVDLSSSRTYFRGSSCTSNHDLNRAFRTWVRDNAPCSIHKNGLLPGTFMGKVESISLNLLVPYSDVVPLSAIAWITALDDITFQLALIGDVAANALALASANRDRLDALERAQADAEKWAMIAFAIDLVAAVVPGGPVLAALGAIIAKIGERFSRLGPRLIGLSIYLSKVGNAFKALIHEKGLDDISARMSRVSSESSILWKLTRKKNREDVSGESTDLLDKSLNFTLVDPTEYIKFNIITNYSSAVTNHPTKDVLNILKESSHLDDTIASSLSVMHRPLQVLPPKLRDIAHWAATHRVEKASQRKLSKWLNDTRHPTHSYVTLTEDIPDLARGTLRKRLTMIGVGDPNPGGKPVGDKGAGIGSYFIEFDVLGVHQSTKSAVLRPRSWRDIGYDDTDLSNIYRTMFGMSHYDNKLTLDDAWGAIIDRTKDRILYDTRVTSIPLSYTRADQIRDIARNFSWEYNLLSNNCQNFAHGLYEYARGGVKPSWLSDGEMSAVFKNQIDALHSKLTWDEVSLDDLSRPLPPSVTSAASDTQPLIPSFGLSVRKDERPSGSGG